MNNTLGIIIIITIVLLVCSRKEYFVIDTITAQEDRLKNPLAIHKDLTDKYSADTHTPSDVPKYHGRSLNTLSRNFSLPGLSDNRKDDKQLLAYNDDIKYEKIVIESLNVEIDDLLVKFLTSINDVVIDKELPIVNKQLSTEQREHQVKHINLNDITYITTAFVRYLNNKTNYSFHITDITKKQLEIIEGSQEELIKQYTIHIFLYEKSINYTKRMSVLFTTKQYIDKKGEVLINKITLPPNTILDSDSILPPARTPIDLNTITEGDSFYMLKNKLGLTLPFNTSDVEFLITEEDIKKEEERRQKVERIRKEYTCFGIRQSEQVTNEVECLDFGGYWDKEVESDFECPFYLVNKNYTNEQGGSRSGYCSHPSGVKIIGYRFYDKEESQSIPICYNCKTDLIGQGSLGECCDKQKNNYIDYPLLKSPDYKFPGDSRDRYNAIHELEEKGLSYN